MSKTLNEIEEIHELFFKKAERVIENNDKKTVEKIHKKLIKNVCEAIGDNKVDNMMTELTRSAEVEMLMFMTLMMSRHVRNFSQSYQTPAYEEFGQSLSNIVSRYVVMDGTEQSDLFAKIEAMFKDIAMKNFNHLGPEVAEQIGVQYAAQMIKYIKSKSLAANTELYPNVTWF